MNMIRFSVNFNQICFKISADFSKYSFHRFKMDLLKDIFTVFGNKDQMNMKIENTVST